ncbi:MAG: carboxymuconolactone decarboxylase family protein [Alphaproteobacteria bacterium]|nr:carboxymuconolactone decarboxylase family protein [Alphaproteobacteria bacterium]
MSRIAPLEPKNLTADMANLMNQATHFMGFTPNDALIMARLPALAEAVNDMLAALYGPNGKLPIEIKRLATLIFSAAAGCTYCTSHTAFGAAQHGIPQAKLDALWEYQTSPLFSEAERAALQLAQTAAFTPPLVTDEIFANVKNYFSDDEIIELVGVIAVFSFLNKWNSVLATEIENDPLSFIRKNPIPLNKANDKAKDKAKDKANDKANSKTSRKD